MNEYVITFKYDNEGYMRHIVADCEDDAVGIAFARTRGMLKEFDAKNVTSLDVKEIGKKEIRAATRLTFNAEDGEMPVLTGTLNAPPPVSRNLNVSPSWFNNTTVQLTMREAVDIANAEGLTYLIPDFRMGWQFTLRGQSYIISLPESRNEAGGYTPTQPATTEYIQNQNAGQLNQAGIPNGTEYQRATNSQFDAYQRQLNAAIDTVVPNNPGVYARFVERLQQVPAWQPTPATWDTQGHPTTG